MRRFLLAALTGLLIGTVAFGADVRRLISVGDINFGSGTFTDTAGLVLYKVNADNVPFSQDNDVKVGTLYYLALAADNGVSSYCLKSAGDNTFYWGVCSTVSDISWDNVAITGGYVGTSTNKVDSGWFSTFYSSDIFAPNGVFSIYKDGDLASSGWRIAYGLNASLSTGDSRKIRFYSPATYAGPDADASYVDWNIDVNGHDNVTAGQTYMRWSKGPWAYPTPLMKLGVDGSLWTSGSIETTQITTNCSATDNECYVNAYNYGPPADNTAGNCGYDNSAEAWGCWTSTGFVAYGAGGSMVYPGAGIPNSTGSAWDTSYALDTDLSSVSGSDNTIPSAKATKAALDLKAPLADPVFTSSVQIPNGSAPTVDAAGEIAVDTSSNQLIYYGSSLAVVPVERQAMFRMWDLSSANNGEYEPLFYANKDVTIKKMVAAVVGGSSPSIVWTVYHDTTMEGTTNQVVTGGTTTTTTSTVTSFNDATIPAGSFVRMQLVTVTNTADGLFLFVIYEEDRK